MLRFNVRFKPAKASLAYCNTHSKENVSTWCRSVNIVIYGRAV